MNPMNEELAQLLINLRLKAIAARLDEYLSAAERDGTPFATLLTQLLRAEWQARQQAALAARLKRAQLPETWTLETFPFKLQTGVKERQIRARCNDELGLRCDHGMGPRHKTR
jgi:DNA replication protein DnaC